MRGERIFAVIAGGGTAGHVMPAIAIGEALVRRGHPRSSLRFVGSSRGMEARLIPKAGFEVTLLPGRGMVRRASVDNVGASLGLALAAVRALVTLRRLRPSVLVCVGGYASVAATFAAWAWRVPIVVAEQNAVPGLANRLAGRVARHCAIAFEGTPLPRAVLTGNPVRPDLLGLDRSESGRAAARALLGLPAGARVVLATGGSLGSRRINEAVAGLALRWAARDDVALRHVVGERDWDGRTGIERRGGCEAAHALVYQRVRFEDRMDLAYRAADVVVARAGGAVSELAVAGVASVLVPLPSAPGDHQSANARRMAAAGAAVTVPDAELSDERLGAELEALLADPARLRAMGLAARGLARPDAAERIAVLAESAATKADEERADQEPAGSAPAGPRRP